MLDAGSSHTALYIYKWPAGKENGTGVVTQHSECHVKGMYQHSLHQKLNYLKKKTFVISPFSFYSIIIDDFNHFLIQGNEELAVFIPTLLPRMFLTEK